MLFLKAEFHQLFWSCLHISADNREPMCQPQPEPHFPTVKNEVFIFRKAIKITWKISEHAQGGSQTHLEFKNTNLHASNFRKEGTVTEKKKKQQQHDPTYFLQHPGAAEEDTNKLIRGEFCNNPSHDFFLQISSSIRDSHAITNKILTVSQL